MTNPGPSYAAATVPTRARPNAGGSSNSGAPRRSASAAASPSAPKPGWGLAWPCSNEPADATARSQVGDAPTDPQGSFPFPLERTRERNDPGSPELSVTEEGRSVPGIDFNRLRAEITMAQVLDLLAFEPVARSGSQWYGCCPLHETPAKGQRYFSVNLALAAITAIAVTATVTPSNCGLLLPSGPCIRQPSICVNGSAERFPGLSVGEPGPTRIQRRGHRYSSIQHPSRHGMPID